MPDDEPRPPHVVVPVERSRLRRPTVAVVAFMMAMAAAVVGIGYWRSTGSSGASAGAAPHYVDETAGSGITHQYAGGFNFFVGGGLASFDCNGDGRDELYIAGGTAPATLYLNRSETGARCDSRR